MLMGISHCRDCLHNDCARKSLKPRGIGLDWGVFFSHLEVVSRSFDGNINVLILNRSSMTKRKKKPGTMITRWDMLKLIRLAQFLIERSTPLKAYVLNFSHVG